MGEQVQEHAADGQARVRPRTRASGLVVLAAAATVTGAGMWAYAAVTRTQPAVQAAGASQGTGDMGAAPTALSASDAGLTGRADAAQQPGRRLIDEGAPALFGFGASFLAAYFLAWALRKFVKLTLLVAGAVAAAVLVLQKLGVIGPAGDQFRQGAERSVEWVSGQGSAVRQFVTGYLPSAVAGIAGFYKGFRSS